MKERVSFLCLLFCIFYTQNMSAFTHQKTIDGESFTWAGSNTDNVYIFVNGINSSGIDPSDIVSRVVESSDEWNQVGGPSIVVSSSLAGEREASNDVYFTDDSYIFSGSSVLAVTESVYNSSTGRIIESDIKIKDSILFSNSSDSDLYIGDLISHEMGHLIGLDHSTMPFSTMFYKLIRGQHSTSFDDLLGKESLYGEGRYSGKISGTIAGGADQINVFGADIKLISSNSGKVVASTLSQDDGSYSFDSIPLDDVYYIYIAPLKAVGSVSSYYQTIETDFCSSYESFRGSFYQSCGNSRQGYPVGIELDSSNKSVDTGIITIKCGLDVPLGYLDKRGVSAFELDDRETKEGDSFVGFFSNKDVSEQNYDEIYVDLSDVDTSNGNYFLDLRVISQELYSRFAYEMDVFSESGDYHYSYSMTDDNTGNLNLKGQIPLSSDDPSKNIFTIKITPQDFDQFKVENEIYLESLFFPDFQTFGDDKFFYQFIYFLSKEGISSEVKLEGHYKYSPEGGNERCMDAEETYSVKSSGSVTGVTNSSSGSSDDASILSCGSVAFIDKDNDSGQGGGNAAATIIVGFLLASFLTVMNRQFNQ